MDNRPNAKWADLIPEGDSVSTGPTYTVGTYFDRFREDRFTCGNDMYTDLKYWYYDPTEHGYPEKQDYPLLIFLHGASNSLVGTTCINYTGAELFASPAYQADIRGAYILIPVANERRGENGVEGQWRGEYTETLFLLIDDFIRKHTEGVGKKYLFGNSAGARMTLHMGTVRPGYFHALIPVGSAALPDDGMLDLWEQKGVHLFFAIGMKDEFNDYETKIAPRTAKLKTMKHCFIYTPEWVRNGDKRISSIDGGIEMGQHCLMNAVQANLMFDDGTPMDERLPRGMTGWIDEVNRDGAGRGREYAPHGGRMRTGHAEVADGISLYYEEYGSGDRVILSAQMGFYHRSVMQKMAENGYHVYCITLRGFHPSSPADTDYGENWYDVFASDVIAFADRMGIDRFSYMGASHGAGTGWHLMLQAQERVDAFIAMVPGPHSLKEGTMSWRQMAEQGVIQNPPPFDLPVDNDPAREERRVYRDEWISGNPRPTDEERKIDYGRPLMRMKTEEKLREALKTVLTPVLIIGGTDDPISTPELMIRTANSLPHCKLVIYSNCGHNIDTDLIEEVADEADRFIRNALKTGKWYLPAE
ncbi:MAG: alpha/beta fold hydrolase [Clostridia bacterium]|nr:alpha/beta fold hydrolase [Clostridia bacterium]